MSPSLQGTLCDPPRTSIGAERTPHPRSFHLAQADTKCQACLRLNNSGMSVAHGCPATWSQGSTHVCRICLCVHSRPQRLTVLASTAFLRKPCSTETFCVSVDSSWCVCVCGREGGAGVAPAFTGHLSAAPVALGLTLGPAGSRMPMSLGTVCRACSPASAVPGTASFCHSTQTDGSRSRKQADHKC